MRKQTVIVIVIIIVMVLFWYSSSLQKIFQNSTEHWSPYIKEHQIEGIAAFIGLAALSAMLSFFSSAPLVPVAVAIWGNVPALLLLLSGWMVGGMLAYLIGSYGFYPFLRRVGKLEKIEYYQHHLPEHLRFTLVLLFRLAMPAEIPGYVLGILRYDFKKYLLATLLAELPFAVLAVQASGAVLSRQPLALILLVLVGLVAMAALLKIFSKKFKPDAF